MVFSTFADGATERAFRAWRARRLLNVERSASIIKSLTWFIGTAHFAVSDAHSFASRGYVVATTTAALYAVPAAWISADAESYLRWRPYVVRAFHALGLLSFKFAAILDSLRAGPGAARLLLTVFMVTSVRVCWLESLGFWLPLSELLAVQALYLALQLSGNYQLACESKFFSAPEARRFFFAVTRRGGEATGLPDFAGERLQRALAAPGGPQHCFLSLTFFSLFFGNCLSVWTSAVLERRARRLFVAQPGALVSRHDRERFATFTAAAAWLTLSLALLPLLVLCWVASLHLAVWAYE